jgi:hypothetical protein
MILPKVRKVVSKVAQDTENSPKILLRAAKSRKLAGRGEFI